MAFSRQTLVAVIDIPKPFLLRKEDILPKALEEAYQTASTEIKNMELSTFGSLSTSAKSDIAIGEGEKIKATITIINGNTFKSTEKRVRYLDYLKMMHLKNVMKANPKAYEDGYVHTQQVQGKNNL